MSDDARTPRSAEQVPRSGTLDELKELLRTFDTAMITTWTPMGVLRARPMVVQQPSPDLDVDLWFVTSLDSGVVSEIAHEHQVGVTCSRHRDRAYLSISAIARVRRDEDLVRKLYRPAWDEWFPDGPTDPTIALIEMEIQRGEFWTHGGGTVRMLYELARAIVTGRSAYASATARKV